MTPPLALGDVGVVIVTHNSSYDVADCLASLATAELAAVVVVDNGSTDGTPELAEQLAAPMVSVVRQGNEGFSRGCNTGLARLPEGVRAVLLLNPDARLSKSGLQTLLSYLDDNPTCALVAPRLFRDGEPLTSAGRLPTLRSELSQLLPSRIAARRPSRRFAADFATTGAVPVVEGACMLVRADQLRALGGLDPGYFLFFEEMDLARRLQQGGHEVHLCAHVAVEHAVGASRVNAAHGARHFLEQSRLRYLARWHPGWQRHLYLTLARPVWRARVRLGKLPNEERLALLEAARRGGESVPRLRP